MVHSSMKNMQHDRRLQGRRGWADAASFQKYLEELPDVADKGQVVADEPEAEAPRSTPPEPPAPGSGYSPSDS